MTYQQQSEENYHLIQSNLLQQDDSLPNQADSVMLQLIGCFPRRSILPMGKPAHWLISQPVTVEQTREIWGGFTSGNLKKKKKIQQIHNKRLCWVTQPTPVVVTSLDCSRCEIKCRGRSHLIQIIALLWAHSQNIPPPIVCHRDKQGLGKLWLSKSQGGAGSTRESLPAVSTRR